MKLSYYYQLSSKIIPSVRTDLVYYHYKCNQLGAISIKSVAVL